MGKHTQLLNKYEEQAKSAAQEYRNTVEKLHKKAKDYNIDVTYEIDLAKARLSIRENELRSEFKTDLAKSVSDAKQDEFKAGHISKVEADAAQNFIDETRLMLAVEGAASTTAYLLSYAEVLTSVQRQHVLRTLASDLQREGVDLRAVNQVYQSETVRNARKTVEDLNSIAIEDPCLSISTLRRSHETLKGDSASVLNSDDYQALDE